MRADRGGTENIVYKDTVRIDPPETTGGILVNIARNRTDVTRANLPVTNNGKISSWKRHTAVDNRANISVTAVLFAGSVYEIGIEIA